MFVDSYVTVDQRDDGGFIIAYSSFGGSVYTTYARFYEADGTPEGPSQIAAVGAAGRAAVTETTSDGAAIVNTSPAGIYVGSIIEADGTQVAVANLGDVENLQRVTNQFLVGVDTLTDGCIAAAVPQYDANGEITVFVHFVNPDGTSVASPIEVAEWFGMTFDSQYKPEILAPEDGNTRDPGIYIKQFDAIGAEVGDPIYMGLGS